MNRKWSSVLALFIVLALIAALGTGCQQRGGGGGGETTEGAGGSDVKAAMVTDVGGLGDKSFNDLSWAGLQRAEQELGVEVRVLESKEIADYESNIDQLANSGFSPIFAVGFLMTDVVSKVSTAYPDVHFGGVDEFFDPVPENVVGLNFREQEGCYLAGIVAAMATTNSAIDDRINDDKVIGFVGGMDVPLIKKFEAGFKAGAQSVDPEIEVVSIYAGNFNDQAKGKELGLTLIDRKADIIFAAAGGTGLGTIQACKEQGALFIGVDADQYETVPDARDIMLTSVVKRVDTAVFETVKAEVDGNFPGGQIQTFGLKEEGMALAPFHDFEDKVPQEIKDKVEEARTAIIDGSITVPEVPEG